MDFLKHYKPIEGRYLVFEARQGCGGLGDRLVGLVSAFVWALLTQRHFRIAWDTPFPLRTVLQPGMPRLRWDRQDYQKETFRELWLIDRIESQRDYFRSADLLSDAGESNCIAANQPFVTWLLENHSLRTAIDDYGFTGPEPVFRNALSALFRPAPALVDAWQVPARSLWRKNSIGLQIRTLWNWQDGGGRLAPDELEHFYSCADHLLKGTDDAAIFVTSDEPAIIDRTRRRFPGVAVVALEGPILHMDRSEWSALNDYRATFVNLNLLAACRHLVISNWSNFGRIAAFLSGGKPWITRKEMIGRLYPIVREPFRQANLAELLSKDEPPPFTTYQQEAQPCATASVS